MAAPRGPVARIAALVIYIIVILVATPQAQQPVSFAGSPGAIVGRSAGACRPTRRTIDLLRGALDDPQRRLARSRASR